MLNDKDWFIRERSEAVASLLLTSRNDVNVRDEREHDNGVDLIVELLDEDRALSTKFFVVQVRGTLATDKSQWMGSVKQLFKQGPYYLPACVFVVNVRDNTTEYAWLARPEVADKTATLKFFEQGEFLPLDEKAVDEIVGRVEQWYEVLPRPAVAQST